jgi:hypothetical protein
MHARVRNLLPALCCVTDYLEEGGIRQASIVRAELDDLDDGSIGCRCHTLLQGKGGREKGGEQKELGIHDRH